MNIWMIHHGGFFNRGCEAIVQSTVELIRGAGKEPVTFYLVSQEAEVDRATPHPAGLVILDARATYRPWHLLHALWRRPGWGRAAVRAPQAAHCSGTSTSRLPTWFAALTRPASSICSTSRAALL